MRSPRRSRSPSPGCPTSASKQADRIEFTYWFATVICLALFAVVMAILVYAMINFRAKPGDWSDGPPVHGNTTIEIVWTVIPAVLVTAISVVSAVVLTQNGNAGSNPLVVRVLAQQFAWSFKYANGTTSPILRLPVDRTVKLQITASDVLHSFWVPEFAQKQDAVPGQVNDLVITPTRTGTFPVICTELCGLGHSLMRSATIVMPQAAFTKWLAGTTLEAAAGRRRRFGGVGDLHEERLRRLPYLQAGPGRRPVRSAPISTTSRRARKRRVRPSFPSSSSRSSTRTPTSPRATSPA